MVDTMQKMLVLYKKRTKHAFLKKLACFRPSIARVVVPGVCSVGRNLARRDHKRKGKVPKMKYGVPRIHRIQNYIV